MPFIRRRYALWILFMVLQNYASINPFWRNCQSFENFAAAHKDHRKTSEAFIHFMSCFARLLLLLLLLLLWGPCYFILFFCDIHVQLLQQHFGGHSGLGFGGVWFPIFCDFCKPVVILFTCLPFDSGPSCDILNLADVADVFVANSIPQSVASTLKSSSFTRVFLFFFIFL